MKASHPGVADSGVPGSGVTGSGVVGSTRPRVGRQGPAVVLGVEPGGGPAARDRQRHHRQRPPFRVQGPPPAGSVDATGRAARSGLPPKSNWARATHAQRRTGAGTLWDVKRVPFSILAAALCACGGPEVRKDVVYDGRSGTSTVLDVYLPPGEDTRPAVLLIHGGAWRSGSKAELAGTAKRLASSGYVAASINYRLVPGGEFPKNFQDCQCALSFLRAHAGEYRIDPDRIAAMGYSAGGHLASLLGVAAGHPELTPDCDEAAGGVVAPPVSVIDGSGPTDLRKIRDLYREATDNLMGGTPEEVPHAYDLASPLLQVGPGEPPFLIVSDDLVGVDLEATARMRDALVAAGNDARLLVISGGWHVIVEHTDPGNIDPGITTETPEAWVAIEDFLARTVGRP